MPHGLDTVGAGTQNAAAMAGGLVAPHGHGLMVLLMILLNIMEQVGVVLLIC